jgi:hypothetical protein
VTGCPLRVKSGHRVVSARVECVAAHSVKKPILPSYAKQAKRMSRMALASPVISAAVVR